MGPHHRGWPDATEHGRERFYHQLQSLDAALPTLGPGHRKMVWGVAL
jgi:hypothetical protein